jgi:hypothetical protein
MIRIFVLVLLMGAAAMSGVPEGEVRWRSFEEVPWPGDDHPVECTVTYDLQGFRVVVFNWSENSWSWSLVDLDLYGNETGRRLLEGDEGVLEHWVECCFRNDELAALKGSRLGPGPVTLMILPPGEEAGLVEIPVTGLEGYPEVAVTSMEALADGSFIIAGTGMDASGDRSCFTGRLDDRGVVTGLRTLPARAELQLEDTSMEVLEDGTFLLSFEEDAFMGGIAVARLDAHGTEMWSAYLETGSEFTSVINGFLQLENGDIICAGAFDEPGTLKLRGLLARFDPALSVAWQSARHYRDQTCFTGLLQDGEGRIICHGWTAEGSRDRFAAENIDVLLAEADPHGEWIFGVTVPMEGDQIPAAVFERGIGEYYVIGEHRPDGGGNADLFLGRVVTGNFH